MDETVFVLSHQEDDAWGDTLAFELMPWPQPVLIGNSSREDPEPGPCREKSMGNKSSLTSREVEGRQKVDQGNQIPEWMVAGQLHRA